MNGELKVKSFPEYNSSEGFLDSTKKTGNQEQKAQWGRHIEFILTLIGFAVGLGNVWRFPYLCYKNGGGAFIIPYFISLVIIGIPIFFMEVAFGQFSGLGPITIWRINPPLKGLGMAMVTVNSIIGMYYSVVISYALYFLFASMTSQLPWESCDNEWNTCACNRLNNTISDPWNNTRPECISNVTGTEGLTDFFPTEPAQTASQEYFYRHVLEMSSGIGEPGKLKWQLTLCNLLAWTIVFVVLIKGVQSLGKVVYFAATFPYVLLTVLLVRGLTLEGSELGIEFYLKPDLNRLMDAKVWSDAAVQIFYSLSACSGGLIAMASYNKFSNNCLRDALIVPFINCLTSFYAGFVIFSVLGFMATAKGVPVANVTESGPGLAFVVYPEAISRMPVAPVWAILFFLMLCTLGFSSQFSIVESTCTAIIDEFPKLNTPRNKIITRFFICAAGFLIGLSMTTQGGQYVLNMIDTYIGGLPLLIVGFCEVTALNWMYGHGRFLNDIEMMLGRKPFLYFSICWCLVTPVALLGLIGFYMYDHKPLTLDEYVYPDWGNGLGWMVAMIPVVCIPVYWLYYVARHGGIQLVKQLSLPKPSYRPNNKDTTEVEDDNDKIFNVANGYTAEKTMGITNPSFEQQ